MHYYFLNNNLFTKSELVEPNPLGIMLIYESDDISIKKDFFSDIKFTKIIFNATYERNGKEYNVYFDKNKRPISFTVAEEMSFGGFEDMFKTENFSKIFSSKKLAIDTAKNIMNNLVMQFKVTLLKKHYYLDEEKLRYDNFAKMLDKCKRELRKI